MIHPALRLFLAGCLVSIPFASSAADEPDVARGARFFQACAACHALEPGLHLTGPSLATIWGREAATVKGFQRYSDALKHSGIVWNEKSLDAWLRNPKVLVPGNRMLFQGIDDEQARSDLIAYLRAISNGSATKSAGGGGMMDGPRLPDLRELGAENLVSAIRYCPDSYYVTLESGAQLAFWEFNLRFKTDSSERGPLRGKPVLVPGGMMGDRAQAIFSSPEEISAFIKRNCTPS